MNSGRRHNVAMLPLGQAMPGALAQLLRSMPPSEAKVALAWRAVAGTSLARATRVAFDGGGELRVDVRDEAWRRAVGRASDLILQRLAALLGEGVVTSLAIRVRTGTGSTGR